MDEAVEATSRRRRSAFSPFMLLGILYGHISAILFLAAISSAVAWIGSRSEKMSYSSVATFIPQGFKKPSASGLASQFFGAVAQDGSQTPAFYVELMQSREIRKRVANSQYELSSPKGVRRGTLPYVLGYKMTDSTAALDKAIDFVAGALNVTTSPTTGLVKVKATAREPALAPQLAMNALRAVDAFNRETARAQATQQRNFAELGLIDFKNELRGAEQRLQEYLQRNKDVTRSSEAAFEAERLSREVTLRQQLYSSVSQAFQQARLEELRDVPQITVIDRAEVPRGPNAKASLRQIVMGGILGLFAGLAMVLVGEFAAYALERSDWRNDWDAARRGGLRTLAGP